MIELHTWDTPNGQKVSIMLEEIGASYSVVPVDIGAGRQLSSAFLEFSPNGRIPAIVDRTTGSPIAIFESGAILIHLAEQSGKFLSKEPSTRAATIQWLMWQMAGLGPMTGQWGHFARVAPQPADYAINRYRTEVHRLLGVLDLALSGSAYLAGEYSIADMAAFPWVRGLQQFFGSSEPSLFDGKQRTLEWVDRIGSRDAVQRGLRASAAAKDAQAAAYP